MPSAVRRANLKKKEAISLENARQMPAVYRTLKKFVFVCALDDYREGATFVKRSVLESFPFKPKQKAGVLKFFWFE